MPATRVLTQAADRLSRDVNKQTLVGYRLGAESEPRLRVNPRQRRQRRSS